MPFNIKFKKSRQYSVMSKSLFVLKIELLDSSTIDCTLSSESTGQECLDNVCQRIGIAQPEFFGLKYLFKSSNSSSSNANLLQNSVSNEYRWIELNRPLNRQLEKHAANTKILYLRVMYYVISGISLIHDEVTRNYYFLQLKNDVVDGKLECDVDKAVHLSNLARQAEYGNHQERHTVEYLKTLLSFPNDLIDSHETREELTERVILRHKELHNISQRVAEELYIKECQQLDGYGQEPFFAKDMGNNEITLGISCSGITMSRPNYHKFFAWHDISNVVNHKKAFNIECTDPEQSIGFTLADSETGRYVWRVCVLQHTFFKNYEQKQIPTAQLTQQQIFQECLPESREDLVAATQQSNWNVSDNHLAASTSNFQSRNSLQASTMDVNLSNVHLDYANGNQQGSNWAVNLANSNVSLINREQSSSCLDLSNNNLAQDRDRLKALLPQYRPAPDYETAIQQKYRASASDIKLEQQNLPPAMILKNGSTTDMHRYMSDTYLHGAPAHLAPYPDVTHNTNPPMIGYNVAADFGDHHGLTQRFKMMRLVTAPPPYPVNRLSSTSTPDLHALLGYRNSGPYNVSGSSPDLVSSRTFISNVPLPHHTTVVYPAHTLHQNIMPHGTYENLNSIMEATGKSNGLLPASHMHKIYEIYDQNPVLLHPADYQEKPLIAAIQPKVRTASQEQISRSAEPIYENIPLPKIAVPHENNDEHVLKVPLNKSQTIANVPSSSATNISSSNPPQKHKFEMTNGQTAHQMLAKATSNPISTSSSVSNMPSSNSANHHSSLSNATTATLHEPSIKSVDHADTSSNSINFNNNNSSMLKDHLNRSQSTTLLESSHSSNYTIDSNTTRTTTDSGVSFATKEKKKNSIWNLLGRKGEKDKDKQKSATLGRDKGDKTKKGASRDSLDGQMKHRWSTGTSKLQPLPTTLSKEKLCQLLEMKLADPELFYEFEGIPKHRENARYDCALQPENKQKNVDPNFLPYDDNRVRLTPSRENRLGYVNASYITCTVGRKQRFYIVAQSPNAATVSSFWQCVWEADVYLLIQLTDEFQYVPTNGDRCLEYGQYQVWREFSQQSDVCTTSKLRVYHTQTRRYRSVWHLMYNNWGDQNCPKDVNHYLRFIEELGSVRLESVNEVPTGHNTNPPVLMHCNDGAARSGLTVAADLFLYVVDHNQELDIPRVICQLRHQRFNFIPLFALYKFIYSLLIHYLKQTRLI
ncbi:tyrosine-protein phosphatase non-receptor type 21 [Culicoides brevitarsis]|uniref:tyrosine-protein phosphatase non-receptor type 21 n=1 Tax=Culicoides brevitarsis TaxID=469753 RepID=UPI00307BB8DF